jgi:cytoskeleton protein RodZ
MTEATGVGQELAAAREARGLALVDVAQQLKFAPRQIEALEQERFDELPGVTFARGMVRSYARLLQLDPEPLVQRIAGRFDVPDSNRLAARYDQSVPFSDSGRRSSVVYLAVSLGVLVLVGAVAYEWHDERSAAEKNAATIAKVKPAAREATPPVAPEQPLVQEKIVVTETAAPPPAVAPAPLSPPTSLARSGGPRIVVRTEGEAWIEIKDSADRMLISSLNPPGSERVVRGTPPYSLVIGNAKQVTVTYNDKPIDLAPHIKYDVARFTIR